MTLLVKSIQKVNFQGTLSSTKLAPEAFNHFGFNMFLGLNFLMFNVQFNYYPKSLFNPLYVSPEGLKSYAGQPEHAFVIKTSINVPYGFLSHKYFWWRKVLKGTPWR